jgi:hypothetical protein
MKRTITVLAAMATMLLISTSAALALPSDKIFFENDDNCMNTCTMNGDGTGVHPFSGGAFRADVSPDGTMIAYVDGSYDQDIYVMNADGSGRTNLTKTSTGFEDDPTWSPDGNKIAYERNGAIWTMNADGSNQTLLTSGYSPDWSPNPNDSRIAFTREGASDQDIYAISADGSYLRNLTNDSTHWQDEPEWSPGGTMIAYEGNTTGLQSGSCFGSGIYTMDLNGFGKTRITNTTGQDCNGPIRSDETPQWSPDGSKIAFERYEDFMSGPGDIWTANTDGSGLNNITETSAVDDYMFDWGRYEASIADPVKTYAPRVYLHPEEQYFPGNAYTFLRNSQLRWDKPNYGYPGCKDDILAAGDKFPKSGVPLINYDKLSGGMGKPPYQHRDTVSSVDADGNWSCVDRDAGWTIFSDDPPSVAKKEKPEDTGFVLNLKGSNPNPYETPTYRGDPSLQAPAYTEFEPKRYIIYWFFYDFNGWTWRSNVGGTLKEYHEGDWEHIVVKLDDNNQATKVAYYQHYCDPETTGNIYDWDDPKLGKVNGTHPKVYSAIGGHASYPKVGDGDPVACWLEGSVLDFVSAKGKHWDTWKHHTNARDQAWYGYGGNWGDHSSKSSQVPDGLDNYGPEGPGQDRSQGSDVVPAGW